MTKTVKCATYFKCFVSQILIHNVDKKNALQPEGVSRYLTLVSNNSRVTCYLEQVLSSAKLKHDAGAYVHWFDRYGCHKARWIFSLTNMCY